MSSPILVLLLWLFSPKTGGADPVARCIIPLGGLAGVVCLFSGKAQSPFSFGNFTVKTRSNACVSPGVREAAQVTKAVLLL